MSYNHLKEKLFFVSGVVANGDFITESMPAGFENLEMSWITFYTDATKSVKVTPTAGTVTVQLSPNGPDGTFRNITDGTFAASAAYDPARVPPNAWGLAKNAKVNLSGVTGAGYFVAAFWRV